MVFSLAYHPAKSYWCSPFDSFRFLFINLDTYDITMHGVTSKALAEEYLMINKNEDKNSPLGLQGLDKRFVAYNGGVGPDQLRWLEQILLEAER